MKTIIVAMLSLVCLFGAQVVLAEDVTNENTGEHSHNTSSEFVETVTNIKNVNTGEVKNEVKFVAETGKNEAEENTGNGSVESGIARFTVAISNFVNSNVTNVGEEEEERGGGRGGGGEVTPPAQIAEATQMAQTVSAGTLPSAGPEAYNQLALLIGLPLLGVMLIRIYELKTGKVIPN